MKLESEPKVVKQEDENNNRYVVCQTEIYYTEIRQMVINIFLSENEAIAKAKELITSLTDDHYKTAGRTIFYGEKNDAVYVLTVAPKTDFSNIDKTDVI